jgi:tetratricopeptide (TPR) repeat protein
MNQPNQLKLSRATSSGTSAEPDAFAEAAAKLSAQRPLRRSRLQRIAADLRGNRLETAEAELRRDLAEFPDDVDAINLMAQVLTHRGRRREAVLLLARCVELEPEFSAARFNYATVLFQLNRFMTALHELDRLLNSDPSNPLFRQLKANVLEAFGENGPSLAICEELATENPSRADSWVRYGHALRAVGNHDKAVESYRRAIACQPSFGRAYWSLANMKTVRFGDGDIEAMRKELARTDISQDDRIPLQFSLGKAYEDRRAYERSWEQYAKANAAMRLRIDYDPDSLSTRVATNKALFAPEFFRSLKEIGCKAPDPIFILGQPRSGSTLVEQILSSHSSIDGTAELPYIPALAGRLKEIEFAAYGIDYPSVLEKLPPATLTAFGEEYMEDARAHRKLGRPFFIDKTPPNYFHVGMIHVILPNAKIIDVRRHPAACCLSMFKQYFSKTNLRLAELGRRYRDYVELMAHFDRVLPGKIHRVIYEDMVADPEAEVRRLLDYLGLPFEEKCLRFYETKRTVLTPSSEQVRRPITGEAVDYWRVFEPWLGPLINALGSAFTAYPNVPEELR